FSAENLEQSLVTLRHDSECAVALDLLVSSHALHQRMHADLSWISGMESGHITARPIFCCLRNGVIATMIEKLEEGFIRCTIIHLFQQLVNFGKEIAGTELALANAPDVAAQFFGVEAVAVKQIPNFGWFTVDKFCAQLDCRIAIWIAHREDTSTNTIA